MISQWYSLIATALISLTISPFALASPSPAPTKIMLLTLADIHFDPFISCHKTTPCPLIDQLRSAPAQQWPALLAAEDHSAIKYYQNTNYRLLKSALGTASEVAAQQHAQFVLILGDFLAHGYRAKFKRYAQDNRLSSYQSFVRKTFSFLNSEIARAFPTQNVYPLLGNNDSNKYDYAIEPNSAFLNNLSQEWSGFLKHPEQRRLMQNQIRKVGYYALDLPATNLRLIMLNSTLFSIRIKKSHFDQLAQAQLRWLHTELQQARAQHQKVLIAMHIPPSLDIYATPRLKLFTLMPLWQTKYRHAFMREVRSFTPQIAGIFTGHLHTDGLQLLTFPEDKPGTSEIPIVATTSISPIYGNNPGFKLNSYDIAHEKLNGFKSYQNPFENHDGERVHE